MKIGYARAPKGDRSLREQKYKLEASGCEKFYYDEFDIKSDDKQLGLKRAIKSLNIGDELVITRLDRVANSLQGLNQLIKRLQKKQASLTVLNQKFGRPRIDANLVADVVNAIAQFECALTGDDQKFLNEIYDSEHDVELQTEAEEYVNQEHANTGIKPSKNDVGGYLLSEFELYKKHEFGVDLQINSVLRRIKKTW